MELVTASELPPRQSYVLLVSGTMNPPHKGHVRIGMAAAAALEHQGHEVVSCLFVPVHDNYMWNKVTAKADTKTPVFPMSSRVAMLDELIQNEGAEASRICRALGYESDHGTEILEESPGYWAPLMPSGYLKTVPTAGLIGHIALNLPELQQPGRRLGLVFGVDNLAGMASWNRPGSLLARADLILLGRAMGEVKFGKDPSALLSSFSSLEVCTQVPVVYDGKTIFGDVVGRFANKNASGSATVSLLPPLENELETLSSTRVRECLTAGLHALTARGVNRDEVASLFDGAPDVATLQRRLVQAVKDAKGVGLESEDMTQLDVELSQCLATLCEHGYMAPSLTGLFTGLLKNSETLERINSFGEDSGSFVIGNA